MSVVSRLAGALLAETEQRFFLVGALKMPCDYAAHGFAAPAEEPDGLQRPYVELSATGAVTHAQPCLTLSLEGEALAETLARRFVIRRNGSVSDRLWTLVIEPDPAVQPAARVEAAWLGAMPDGVWEVVREQILRCG